LAFIELTPRGERFTRGHEGTVYHIYDDGVKGAKMWKPNSRVVGRLTAGIGHLLNSAEIKQWAGKKIPESVVARWFDEDTDEAEKAVYNLVKVALKPNQRDVLIDFVFNVGVGNFQTSTLLKRVNAARYDEVPEQLLRWTKATINGKKVDLPGLIKRANDRVAYWNSPNFEAVPFDGTDNATNIAEPAPKETSPFEWASLATGALAGLSGFSGATGFLGVAFGAALLVAVGVGAFIVIRRNLSPK